MGLKLKLTGDELTKWSETKYAEHLREKANERDERAAERAAKQAEAETATAARQAELELSAKTKQAELEIELKKAEIERETELKKAEIAAQSIREELEVQLKIKQLDTETAINKESKKSERLEKENQYKKYQGIVRNYTSGDCIAAFTQNFETLMDHYQVPLSEWNIIYMRSLSGEPLKVIETIPKDLRKDYHYLKSKIMAHFMLDEAGYREQFSKLSPKPTQTFSDYLCLVRDIFSKWTSAAKIDNIYQRLEDLIIRDKIISSIASAFSKFLQENECTSVDEIERRGSSYYTAIKHCFASEATDINFV